MKYADEMSPGAMIYIPCFMKIDSGIQKTDRQQGDLTSLLLFFQSKESSLKTEN
jgi:hypothetical protein